MISKIQKHINRLLRDIANKPTLIRWIDILMLSVVLIILIPVIWLELSGIIYKLEAYLIGWPSLLLYSNTVLITAIMSIVLIRLGGINSRYCLSTILRYPPVFVSPFIVAITLIILVLNEDLWHILWDSKYHLVSVLNINLVLISLGILIGIFYNKCETKCLKLYRTPKPNNNIQSHQHNIFENDLDFIDWIFTERPIQNPSEDIFGHTITARRIASLLTRDKPSRIGIVGPYGSGKSGLINLIENFINSNNPSIICIRMSGWGRASGTVAQKILTLAIDEVKQYVDCMSIITLPDNYRQAIGEIKSTGGAVLSAILHTHQEPIAQLSKLNNILIAANLRLVIFLEDLDRNTEDEIIRNEMPALLDSLRTLGQVSFVLSIGTERRFSDILIRICDYTEAIP